MITMSGLASAWAEEAAGRIAPAAGPTPDDPWSMFQGSSTEVLVLLALLPVAVLVFWYGSRQFRHERGGMALRPKGRGGGLEFVRGSRDQKWRNTIERLETRPPTPIAEAARGPLRVVARIVDASGNLGGAVGHECVWRNRAGARPESAVGAELVIVADDSGRCGLENLETARIIAPTETHTVHHESVSLYIGDEIEIFATFEPDKVGDDPDPARLVYGTLGATGGLEVRLIERAPALRDEPRARPADNPAKPRGEDPEAEPTEATSTDVTPANEKRP